MGKFIFITGGARSGKSSFAEKLAKKSAGSVVYLATGQAKDKEMARRIAIHKRSRPETWTTIEEPLKVSAQLLKLPENTDMVILDCLTLLLSNLFLSKYTEKSILLELQNIINTVKSAKFSLIVVSNELGSGIVPENKLAREFRDIAGRANQQMAANSDKAYLIVSGIPLALK
jgi:adenosylcobinamide kinase/adenosylcobinamide-phosphate guanylyltransferase